MDITLFSYCFICNTLICFHIDSRSFCWNIQKWCMCMSFWFFSSFFISCVLIYVYLKNLFPYHSHHLQPSFPPYFWWIMVGLHQVSSDKFLTHYDRNLYDPWRFLVEPMEVALHACSWIEFVIWGSSCTMQNSTKGVQQYFASSSLWQLIRSCGLHDEKCPLWWEKSCFTKWQNKTNG